MSFRPLPILTLFSIAALVLLIVLGNWQYGRYQEKLAARSKPPPEITIESAKPIEGQVQLVYGVKDGAPGWRIFAPVLAAGKTVFLDTAFRVGPQPPDWRELAPFGEGEVAVQGVRMSPHKPSWATAKPEPSKHVWYAIDLPAMARAGGLPAPAPYYVALPYLSPSGRLEPNPFATVVEPLPPERHLGYALTWWGLAGALLAVYAAFHVRAGRLSFGRKP